MTRVDAHHHLWRYTEQEYGWIGPEMASLRHDFLPEQLQQELTGADVQGTVAVQARQSVQETDWLLSLAGSTTQIWGVVGWLPLAAPDLQSVLERYAGDPWLKGLRHVVQGEPAGFLQNPAFNRGVRALTGSGLVYDLLIYAHQLGEATEFVDQHPAQPFVLDHIAKPAIRAGEIQQWARQIHELARRPHVSCKLSGMVTEADPAHWTDEELKPYYHTVLQAFGPSRLMIGTDWPVLTVGCSYLQWWRVVEAWIRTLTSDEQAAILGGTAIKIYGLNDASIPSPDQQQVSETA